MDAMRRRIDVAGQRVRVGRFQLRHLPPVEDFLWQFVALLGEFVEQPRARRPLPGLGLGATGQSHLAEQNVADLLRAADVDGLAGQRVDFGFEAGCFLRELAGQARQHVAVDRNASPLHTAEHGKQRTLQRLIDVAHLFGGEPRRERLPDAEDDVGTLGGIFGGAIDADGVEGDLRLAGLDQFVDVERGVIEGPLGERLQRMAGAAGIDHIRHQDNVVVGFNLDAALREHLPGEFQVVADLEHTPVGEDRPKRFKRGCLANLTGDDIAAEQAGALAALAVRQRHVAGLVGTHRERDAAQLRLHWIEACRRRVHRDCADVPRALGPGLEPVEAAHDLIFAAVELGGARGLAARLGQRLRRQHRGGRRLGPALARQIARLRRPIERKLRRGRGFALAVGRRGAAAA